MTVRMSDTDPRTRDGPGPLTFRFGKFSVDVRQRKLTCNGAEVPLGGRAFDVLLVLLEKPGELVTQDELNEAVWPGQLVDEANLRVHMSSLRKALRERDGETEYIKTVPRRGYSLVESVSAEQAPANADPLPRNLSKVPSPPKKMFGREEAVVEIEELLARSRLVTIVGPGGIGKTSTALSVSLALAASNDIPVFFADLATLTKPEQVEMAIASALGLTIRGSDVIGEVVAQLRSARLLLLLDNCEHLVEAVAAAVGRLRELEEVILLCTSREALRLNGEETVVLEGLPFPADPAGLTAEEALKWPSIALLLEQASASGYRHELTDETASVAARICARVDGIPLALELAGGRVGQHGLNGTAILLDSDRSLEIRGRRDAGPRHKSLEAVVEWSHELLDRQDQIVFARLAPFVGAFSLGAAQQVAADANISAKAVARSLDSLREKSLVSGSDVVVGGYRLLDTTRAFSAIRFREQPDATEIADRHRKLLRNLLASEPDPDNADAKEISDLAGNLHASIAWAEELGFEEEDPAVLVAAAVPFLLRNTMLSDCYRWSSRALEDLDTALEDTATNLALCEGLAVSGMFTKGNSLIIKQTIERGVAMADALGDQEAALRLLAGQHIYASRIGDFPHLMTVSERALDVAYEIGRDDFVAMAEWMMGTAAHLCGDQTAAQKYCERAMRRSTIGTFHLDAFGYDHRIRGLIVLVRVLWLCGYEARARRICDEVITEADEKGQPVAQAIALIYTITVALWTHDLGTADRRIARLRAITEANSLEPYRAVALCQAGQSLVLADKAEEGMPKLREGLRILELEQHRVLSTEFLMALARGLISTGKLEQAEAVLDEASKQAEMQSELYQFAELQRLEGLLLQARTPDAPDIVGKYQKAITIAQEQCTPAWGLRAALSLARHLQADGAKNEARAVLESALSQIPEDGGSADADSARKLLKAL